MKKLLISIIVLLPSLLKAQDTLKVPKLPIDSTTSLVSFRQITDVPAISKSELYSRAREWFALNFKSANKVLQMDDKESGKLIGQANFSGYYLFKAGFGASAPASYQVNFSMNVSVKDYKYRVIITDFIVKMQSGDVPIEQYLTVLNSSQGKKPNKYLREAYQMYIQILNEVQHNALQTSLSLKDTMLKKSKSDDF